jgi:hypothetical protein
MNDTILRGSGRQITKVPREEWEHGLVSGSHLFKTLLNLMSEEHQSVRNFVVRELPNVGEPLSPEFIAQELNLPLRRVNLILDDLEKHLTFLYRNERGAVAWAYPMTVDTTPHHLTFSSGEVLYAA